MKAAPSRLRLALLGLGLALVAALGAEAQPAAAPQRELLNSERIEQAFGSYGIEVLASDLELRVSRLYSTHGGEEICRTFAVVSYPQRLDPELAAEHALILAGQSIGSTFARGGWSVLKSHRYFGRIESTPGLRALMGGTLATELAVHVYLLSVVRGQASFDYARIVEVHHPDYLGLEDLGAIYGRGMSLPTPLDAETRALLALTAAQMPR